LHERRISLFSVPLLRPTPFLPAQAAHSSISIRFLSLSPTTLPPCVPQARADHFYGYGLNSEDIGRLFASAPNALLGSTLPDLQPRLTLLEKLARLGGWQSAGHLLLTYPQLVEASVSKIQTLQRILGSRGIDGPQLVQALAAQTHPTKWAGDLFAMQLNGTVAPGSGR